MITVYATIGNSDDRLTQQRWSEFCTKLHDVFFNVEGSIIHGMWFSLPNSQYQNAIICAAVPAMETENIKATLNELRKEFGQQSIAWAATRVVLLDGDLS